MRRLCQITQHLSSGGVEQREVRGRVGVGDALPRVEAVGVAVVVERLGPALAGGRHGGELARVGPVGLDGHGRAHDVVEERPEGLDDEVEGAGDEQRAVPQRAVLAHPADGGRERLGQQQVVAQLDAVLGQLGDGGTASRFAARPAKGISDAKSVVAGGRHTCAIRGDGTIACFGDGREGQLGFGAGTDRERVPKTLAGLRGVAKLVAGDQHTCALISAGDVRCWGDNGEAQIDSSRSPRPTPTKLTGVRGVVDLARTRARMADKPDDFFLKPAEIAEAVHFLAHQPRSAWTFELDLRPFGERW